MFMRISFMNYIYLLEILLNIFERYDKTSDMNNHIELLKEIETIFGYNNVLEIEILRFFFVNDNIRFFELKLNYININEHKKIIFIMITNNIHFTTNEIPICLTIK